MKFGVCLPNYGETSSTAALRTVSVEAERLGFNSVWCTDHVLLPRNSGTPFERIFESLTTAAYLACTIKTVKLGVSSLIMALRNTVLVVKQLATIDNLSHGRLMLATEAGWDEEEFRQVGSNFHDRGRRVDESIRLLRDLWSGKPKFESELLPQRFEEAAFEPRPVQKHLTVWISGSSRSAMERAALSGDGWHPDLDPIEGWHSSVDPLEQFGKLVSEFRRDFPDAKANQSRHGSVWSPRSRHPIFCHVKEG